MFDIYLHTHSAPNRINKIYIETATVGIDYFK